MRKDLCAKRVLAILGLGVILVSTFALHNIVGYVVNWSSYYPAELFIVIVFFIIAGVRLLLTGVFYTLKGGSRI